MSLRIIICIKSISVILLRPPLWSSGQSFWLQIQRSRVRSPALPDFLSSSGSGMGSTQPREVNWGSYLNEKSGGSRSRKQRLTAVGTRCADHVTPLYPQKLALNSPTGCGCSVGIVRVRTKATEFVCLFVILLICHFIVQSFLIIGRNTEMLQWNFSVRMDRSASLNKKLEERFLFCIFMYPPKLS